jgi:hypothetical protein
MSFGNGHHGPSNDLLGMSAFSIPLKPLIWLNEFAYTQCISLNSTLRGSQGSSPASVNSNEGPRDNIFAEADTNRNRRQGGMSMNAPLDHSLQYTEIQTTSDFSVLSSLPDDYSLPTVVPYQERASTEIPAVPEFGEWSHGSVIEVASET